MSNVPETVERAFKQVERVLAFGAHADDIDITSGGTVALLTSMGKEVIYCVITDGSKGGRETDDNGKELLLHRETEQKSAAEVLGVSDVRFLKFIDGEIENTPDVRRAIVEVIRDVKPDTIFSWDPAICGYDNWARYHRDHRMAGEAVYDAIYPASGNELFFPDISSTPYEPKRVWFYGSARENLMIDIRETIKAKTEAIHRHKSQIPHLEKVEQFINEHAREVGREHGIEYAEAFRYLELR